MEKTEDPAVEMTRQLQMSLAKLTTALTTANAELAETRQLVRSAFSVNDRAIWEENYTRPTRWPHSRTIESVRD